MSEIDRSAPVSSSSMERWPWPLRCLAALAFAGLAVAVTYAVPVLHQFPLLLPFPVAILTCIYLGMGAGALCTAAEASLIDLLLVRMQYGLPILFVREEVRLVLFMVISLVLGWSVRQLAWQRSQLALHDLQRQLAVAQGQRLLAEERARTSETLRERDDTLQIALRANGLGLWVWDLETGGVQWSDEVYHIIGLPPGSLEPAVRSFLQFIHPDDMAHVQEAVDRTRTTGADYHQQYRVRLKDGSERWVESQGRSQRDSTGRLVRIVGVVADVTMRKRSEEAMLRAEKLAVAGRLAASVAHEINNPLEAVANLLYLIANAENLEIARHEALQALDELMRVSLITQQTLKFHRQTGSPKPTRLSEVLQTVFTLFRGRLRTSRIESDLQVKDEIEISCMPGEVQQVFANLVSNAIDAMPTGGRLIARLRPSIDWRDGVSPGMRVTLVDSGGGIDPATRHRIFEPFFTTKPETGTGLGLWVVAQLVERHHGRVSIRSSQNTAATGTVISVFLPVAGSAGASLQA
ncbi:MAG TPA: PAS domain-containing protein [Acidobacteriaceae bacterium]|nr:PAS domain-containing protein [Acidobacteriaceae bacterium]